MPNSEPTEVDEGPECCIGISARHRFLISQPRIRYWIFEVHCMSYLWTFEPEIPDNLGAVMLWKVVILKRKSTFNLWHHWRFCHPRMYQFLMANSWLVVKAKGLAKHLQHFNATSRMMLDQIWKRSNFSCNILDVAWCCNRLATFTQHCCTRACALGALVARQGPGAHKHRHDGWKCWKCCVRLASPFNTYRNIMQQCCKTLRWNVASVWPCL